MKTHVVCTFYRSPSTGVAVSHAYGPYTKEKAKRERRRILAENAEQAIRGHLYVSANRMIDVDAMDARPLEEDK